MKLTSLTLFLCVFLSSCVQMRLPIVTECNPVCPQGETAFCLEPEPLTVDKAVAYAILNNRDLKAIYDKLGVARAAQWQASLLPNPIFSLAYRFATSSGVSALIDMGLMHNFLETLLIPVKKRWAAIDYEIARQVLAGAVFDVMAHTRMAFYTLQAHTQELCLRKEVLEIAEAGRDMAGRQAAAGNLQGFEVTRQHLLYAQAKKDFLDAERLVNAAREALNVWMGLWGSQICWEYDPYLPSLCCESEICESAESCAIAASLDLAIIQNEIQAVATGAKIGVVRQVFPDFDAGVAVERDEGIWYAGPAFAVALPIFDWGQAKTAAAQAEICHHWDRMMGLAVLIRSRVRAEWLAMDNAHQQIELYHQEVIPAAEALTAQMLLQSHAMQIGLIALLDTKRVEVERKIEALHQQKEYWIARTRLETLCQGHLVRK